MVLQDVANLCYVCAIGDGRVHDSRHPTQYHDRILLLVRGVVSAPMGDNKTTGKKSDEEKTKKRMMGLKILLRKICVSLNVLNNPIRWEVTNSGKEGDDD